MMTLLFLDFVNFTFRLECFYILTVSPVMASIVNFNERTIGYDPYDADFSGAASTGKAGLSAASGNIASGTDVAYFSVNGGTVDSSTSGDAFRPTSSFSIANDYTDCQKYLRIRGSLMLFILTPAALGTQ